MKRLVKVSAMLIFMAVLLTGCNCQMNLVEKAKGIDASVNPEVLVKKGNEVVADVTVTFPKNYMHKKAVMRVTPVLVFKGGEIAGTPKYVQGQSVKDNYTVIPCAGGSYTQQVRFPYDSRASISTLELRFEAICGCDKDFQPVVTLAVAQGISDIMGNAEWSDALILMPNNFKRVTTNSVDADLMYLINSSQVRNVALTTDQIKMFEEFVKGADKAENTSISGIYSKGYASPDGPIKFNDELSKARSQTAKVAMEKELKGAGGKIDAAVYGEDWEGFQKLVAASNMKDKDLILQVLNQYSSPVQREEQIKSMAMVYNELKKDILPQLRRAQLVANADVTGKSDAELRSAFTSNPRSLNVEELLYAATLLNDNKAVVNGFKNATNHYNDARVLNNYGVALAKDGQFAAAQKVLTDASKIQSAPAISNNLGVVAMALGNYAEANKYLSGLSASDSRTSKALLNAASNGVYNEADRTISGYNLAVVQLANGEVSKAKSTLGNLDTAKANYLRGVIAMREGNTSNAVTNLKKAFSQDPSLRTKALNDVEFVKIQSQL